MMETIKLLIFCLLLGVCINACSRDEIMIFKEEQNSLNFPKYQYLSTTYKYDSLQFSSVFSGEKKGLIFIFLFEWQDRCQIKIVNINYG